MWAYQTINRGYLSYKLREADEYRIEAAEMWFHRRMLRVGKISAQMKASWKSQVQLDSF